MIAFLWRVSRYDQVRPIQTGFKRADQAASMSAAHLDLGCGNRKIARTIGVDKLKDSAADVICDLNHYPWPFRDNVFETVVCRHTLGHLEDVVAAMEEIHRVTRPGGTVEILTPHFSSDNFFTDITSRHSFGYRSLDYFAENRQSLYRYSAKARFRLLESYISFRQAKVFPGEKRVRNPCRWLGLEWLVNCVPRYYEHFLAFVLRANEVYFLLEVVKD